MNTKIITIAYNLDNDGETKSITVSLAGYDSLNESLSATVFINADDLTGNETLDAITRKDIETLARTKTATYAKGVTGTNEAKG
jgi:hypothetical protein